MKLLEANQEINKKYFSDISDCFLANDLELLYHIHYLLFDKMSNNDETLKKKLLKIIQEAQKKLENTKLRHKNSKRENERKNKIN